MAWNGSKWWCFHESDWDSRYPSTISYIRKYAHTHTQILSNFSSLACSRIKNRGIWTFGKLFFQVACWCPNTKKILPKVTSKKWHPISDPLSDRPSEGWNTWPSFKFHLSDLHFRDPYVTTSYIRVCYQYNMYIPTVYRIPLKHHWKAEVGASIMFVKSHLTVRLQ